MCGSGQQAANFAAMGMMSGQYECVIAGGVENMSRVPMGSNGMGPGEGPLSPRIQALYNIIPQGLSAEMIAEQWGIKREELDEFAPRATSGGPGHRRGALQARDRAAHAGRRQRVRHRRGRAGARQPREDGGAHAVLQARRGRDRGQLQPDLGRRRRAADQSETRGKALGLTPRARIVATALAGVDPTIMLTGPIPATQRVLKKAGLKLDEIDLFEINEAFASVVLAWERELHPDMSRVNVNGGAIALGHPLGCGRQADDHAAARAGAHQEALRAADHVHRLRAGDRHHHRARVAASYA